ncbi:DUF6982 domain-containing protein [Thermodesulfobacteriota bacterium]
MQPNKVVIRFKDGTVAKGQTNDLFPNKPIFHLTTLDGKIEEFNTEELKALFFVKDPDGDKSYEYSYGDTIAGGGRKIKVDFADGEEMIGYTQGYSATRPGFFLIPADAKGNNERVFVVNSATRKVEFL